MVQLDTQIARRLTKYYIMALSVVAILSTAGQWMVQSALKNSLNDARIINIAGRQRMLSQRLTKRAILLCNPKIYLPSSEYRYVSQYNEILKLWQKYHVELRNGRLTAEKILVRKSVQLDSLFRQIELPYQQMSSALNVIMQEYSNPPADTAQAQRALKVLLANERAFLDTMDNIVFQYDQETKEQIVKARNIEFLLTVVVLVVLFLEGIFIFKPVVDYTQSVVNKLLNSEKELKKTNEALLQTNESLFLTREELVKTNAEKYRIQAEENQIKAAALLEGQEAERKRMSRELHDGIGQMLTGLKLQLEQFKEVPFVSLKQQQNYSDLTQLLSETIDATRMVSFSLMPTTLQDFGVAASIRLLANQLNRVSGLKIDTQQVHDIRRVASQTEISLYRIVQEAFNNAIKHAQATQLSASLTLQASNILLVIQDNGQGFEPKAKVRNQQNMTGNGLSNMRTRTELLGGKLTIQSTMGGGTIITVKIPTQEV